MTKVLRTTLQEGLTRMLQDRRVLPPGNVSGEDLLGAVRNRHRAIVSEFLPEDCSIPAALDRIVQGLKDQGATVPFASRRKLEEIRIIYGKATPGLRQDPSYGIAVCYPFFDSLCEFLFVSAPSPDITRAPVRTRPPKPLRPKTVAPKNVAPPRRDGGEMRILSHLFRGRDGVALRQDKEMLEKIESWIKKLRGYGWNERVIGWFLGNLMRQSRLHGSTIDPCLADIVNLASLEIPASRMCAVLDNLLLDAAILGPGAFVEFHRVFEDAQSRGLKGNAATHHFANRRFLPSRNGESPKKV